MFCTYSERQNVCIYTRQHVQYPRERNIEDFMRAHFRRVACARENLYTIKRRALAKSLRVWARGLIQTFFCDGTRVRAILSEKMMVSHAFVTERTPSHIS